MADDWLVVSRNELTMLREEAGKLEHKVVMCDDQVEVEKAQERLTEIDQQIDLWKGRVDALEKGDAVRLKSILPPSGRKTTPALPVQNVPAYDARCYMLGRDDKAVDLMPVRPDLGGGIGEYCCCVVSPDYRLRYPELAKMAMENAGAGVHTVPAYLSPEVVDKARAISAIARAGARTMVFPTETMKIARVATDPTMTVKAESAAWTPTDVVFDSVNAVAKTFGCVVRASQEWWADAPNAPQIVSDTLSRALADQFDRHAIQGAGGEFQGVIDDPNARTTTSVGAIAWEDLATGVVDLWGQNFMPNAYLVSPTIAGDLDALTSGDGSNSAKLWLGAPPPVQPLDRFVTSNCTDTDLVIGDFQYMAICMRQAPQIDISTTDRFDYHQVSVKITWRGDVVRLRSDAFHVLKGITT